MSYKAMKKHGGNKCAIYERSHSEVYNGNYRTFWERQNYRGSKKISVFQGFGSRREGLKD